MLYFGNISLDIINCDAVEHTFNIKLKKTKQAWTEELIQMH